MAWDEEKFNAALANKLKNQDANALATQANATANLMQAQSGADLVPSAIGLRSAEAQAGLMNAATTRGTLAQQSPGALTPQQVSAYGIGGPGGFRGVPLQQQGLRAPTMPVSSIQTAYDQRIAADKAAQAANPSPGMPKALTYDDITKKAYARGGPIGNVKKDKGKDTQKALVRPGEYLLNKEAVEAAFGDGDYDQGVRNLDEIVRRYTGNEPGPTYANGEKSFAEGGPIEDYAPLGYSFKGRNERGTPLYGTARDRPYGGERDKRGYLGLHTASEIDDQKTKNRAAAEVEKKESNERISDMVRENTRFRNQGLPRFGAGGANVRGLRTTAPGTEWFPSTTRKTQAQLIAAHQAAGILPAAPGAAPGAAPNPLLASGASAPTRAKFNALIAQGQGDTLGGQLAGPAPPTPTVAQIGQQEIARNIAEAPAPPQLYNEAATPWAARNKIQAGGMPGEQIALNYGEGHGMRSDDRIYAQANAAGRFNSFSDRPQAPVPAPVQKTGRDTNPYLMAASGGQVPEKPDEPRTTVLSAPAMPRFWNPDSPPVSTQLSRLIHSVSEPRSSFYDKGEERKRGLRMASGGQVPHFATGGPKQYRTGTFWNIGGDKDPFFGVREPGAAFTNLEGMQDPYAGLRTKGAPISTIGGANDPFAGTRGGGAFSTIGGSNDPFAGARTGGGISSIGGPSDPYAQYRTPEGLSRAGQWKRFAQQDVGATAMKGVQAVKEALPSAAGVDKWLMRGGKYLGAPAAAVLAGADIADVATDPNKTKLDVANEVASKGSRWLGAGAGAAAAAPFGAPLGPLGVTLAGLAGGTAGYFGTELGTKGLRKLFGGTWEDPSETSQGAVKKWLNAPAAPEAKSQWEDPAGFAPRPGTSSNAPVAAPEAAPRPSLRDALVKQYWDMENNANPYAGSQALMHKQKQILDYLGQIDPARGGAGDAAALLKASTEHEKEIEASLRQRFKKQVTDDKGKTTDVDDPQAYERFLADAASHKLNVFQMPRTQRDALLAEFSERDLVQQRAKALQTKSGDASQLVSDRTRPVQLKAGLDWSDYWGSPNISLGDYGRSFFGKGLRNQTALMPTYDPVTKKTVNQAFPAAALYENPDGSINLDAYAHATRLTGR